MAGKAIELSFKLRVFARSFFMNVKLGLIGVMNFRLFQWATGVNVNNENEFK